MLRPVSIVTVNYDTCFFVRLLVEKVREFIGPRDYEVIVVDRGSRDGSREWLRLQQDVRLLTYRQWRWNRHKHGEAAEKGVRQAKHEHVVLLDSDAHPIERGWLELTVDRLNEHTRLAGAEFFPTGGHQANLYGSYIHPFFMAFIKEDLERFVVLRKMRGHDTDTGEEATIRLRDAGLRVIGYPIQHCVQFSVGHPWFPQMSGGVFHAGNATRAAKNPQSVLREFGGSVSEENYIRPLQELLRRTYHLEY
jgi:glycosyltransferase involved in cell wall biosynthesis